MSKLMTDSKAMMDFLFQGTVLSDTPLYTMIEDLKEAALDCTELRVTIDYGDIDEMRKKLDRVNEILVESWQTMLGLQNDFKDIIELHFKKGGVA